MHLPLPLLPFDPVAALAELRGPGAVSITLIPDDVRHLLWEEAAGCAFTREPKYTGPNEVEQNLWLTRDLPADGALVTYTELLQNHIASTFARLGEPVFETPLAFNERVVQKYEPNSVGVSLHRDFSTDRNLICISMLFGHGEFCLADNREGDNLRPLDSRPGQVILMRAPGFVGVSKNKRPYHTARKITTFRCSFINRQRLRT